MNRVIQFFLFIIALSLILASIVVCITFISKGFEKPVKAGDIVCWRSDTFKFMGMHLPVEIIEVIYLTNNNKFLSFHLRKNISLH